MIPHWNDSPHWARWLAQDADGQWFWFENEPGAHRGLNMWCTGPGGGRCEWARTSALKDKWIETKRRYPHG